MKAVLEDGIPLQAVRGGWRTASGGAGSDDWLGMPGTVACARERDVLASHGSHCPCIAAMMGSQELGGCTTFLPSLPQSCDALLFPLHYN